jgi:hypothetical protein
MSTQGEQFSGSPRGLTRPIPKMSMQGEQFSGSPRDE